MAEAEALESDQLVLQTHGQHLTIFGFGFAVDLNFVSKVLDSRRQILQFLLYIFDIGCVYARLLFDGQYLLALLK